MDANSGAMSPNTALPYDQKGEKYHKQYHDFLVGNHSVPLGGGGEFEYFWDYYHGIVNPQRDHNHVIRSASGALFPVDFINYNHLLGFGEVLIGELLKNKQVVNTKALSPTALARKRKKMAEFDVDFKLMPLYIEDEQTYGLPVITDQMALSESDLAYKKENYKEEGEKVYGRLAKYYQNKYRWKAMKGRLMEDLIVTARCFLESQMTPHGPRMFYRDPRTVIFDESTKSPWLEDTSFIGTVEYMPITQVVETYGIDPHTAKELREENTNDEGMRIGGGLAPYKTKDSNRAEMVLVSRVQWKDFAYKTGVGYEDKMGREHWHIKQPGTKIKKKGLKEEKKIPYQIVRTCTVVAGKHVVEWGELKNQVRSGDDWQRTGFTIQGFLPRWKNGRSVSIIQQLIPLQKLFDQSMYHIRLAFKKDRGKAFIGDMAALPRGYDIKDQAYYGQVLGIIPIDSSTRGLGGMQYNQFQTVDMSLSPSTSIYIQVAQMALTEMERITGISPARQGVPEAPTQAVGVMDMSRKQSMLRTERFFSGFDVFTEMFFELVLGQYKIQLQYDDHGLANVIGDEGMSFIQND
ncbi:MAG: hypothetical protein ACQ5SW_09100, partial [Sphaerochaetaceae bacterium]